MQKVKVGDVVLIHDNTPRIQWKLAIIEEINKGEDGFIRSANVKTSTGKTNRPITKLYPLEVKEAEQSTMDSTGETATTPTQLPQRPVHQAALRGRQRVQQWIHSLTPPGGCQVLTDRHLYYYCCNCHCCRYVSMHASNTLRQAY